LKKKPEDLTVVKLSCAVDTDGSVSILHSSFGRFIKMSAPGKKGLGQNRAWVLVVFALTVISGCSTSNYGKLKSEPDVTRAFEAYRALPDHRYYYRGTFSAPYVIVGISETYELNSRLWVAIDPQSKDFRTLVERVSLQGLGGTTRPWGFTILDKSGNAVGVWYSASRAAVVDIDENGQITNLSPMAIVTKGNQPR
jgi:hypothetical protein